jgi:hypothetical protein
LACLDQEKSGNPGLKEKRKNAIFRIGIGPRKRRKNFQSKFEEKNGATRFDADFKIADRRNVAKIVTFLIAFGPVLTDFG